MKVKLVNVTLILTSLIFILIIISTENPFLNQNEMRMAYKQISNMNVLDQITNSSLSRGLYKRQNSSIYENHYKDSLDEGYLSYIQQTWIKPQQLRTRSESKGTPHLTDLAKPGLDYSEVGQSVFVSEILGGKKRGVFVESGAGNGEDWSNTLYLEMELGWTGLLVEPNPSLHEQLHRKRRNCFISNTCLNTEPYSQHRQFVEQNTWSRVLFPGATDPKKNARISNVQCFPLNALLNSLRIEHIDYLSLDTEGSELYILKTISLTSCFIDVIGVEYRVTIGKPEAPFIDFNKTLTKLQSLRTYFKDTGLYKELGILPRTETSNVESEMFGLDVFFKRL